MKFYRTTKVSASHALLLLLAHDGAIQPDFMVCNYVFKKPTLAHSSEAYPMDIANTTLKGWESLALRMLLQKAAQGRGLTAA